jgi:hypothetical protein
VVVSDAVAVLVHAVAVIVQAGWATGSAGVLEVSGDADELALCCTYTLAAVGGGWHVVLIGSAVAVVIHAVAVIVCSGWVTGVAGVLRGSADADELALCCT